MSQPKSSQHRLEEIKQNMPGSAERLARMIRDPHCDHFEDDDVQFLKFHGVYQQDDRDVRKTARRYRMMTRVRIPGGVLRPDQWRVLDSLADRCGDGTLRITTRQSIQFHGVALSGLREMVAGINETLLTTLGSCGDVARNVMVSAAPAHSGVHQAVQADARRVAEALAPRIGSYHSVWIDGARVAGGGEEQEEGGGQLYGDAFLPRKFKTAFVIPPSNDTDVLANCMGFIAIAEQGRLLGYNLCLGGGMGRNHGNCTTYPRLADVIGFFPPEKVVDVARAVVSLHRDFGSRGNRRTARMKYVIAKHGADWAGNEVSRRAGLTLEPARNYHFTDTKDRLGWSRALDGSWFFGLFVSSGRVKEGVKNALRGIAERFPEFEFRLTANQNLIIAGVGDGQRRELETVLEKHGVSAEKQAGVLLAASMACPALPTCGYALAEAERFLPGLIRRIESLAAELGLTDEEIIIRNTGCSFGCTRPYIAELAFVGKAPGKYQIWAGGNMAGTRIGRIWRESVADEDLDAEMRTLLSRFAAGRLPGERFGDWAHRSLADEPGASATPTTPP